MNGPGRMPLAMLATGLARRIVCGPAGPDRDTLAAEFQRA